METRQLALASSLSTTGWFIKGERACRCQGASASAGMIEGLQERAARAVPAQRVQNDDGWWLQHDHRCSWWVGTVLPPHQAVPDELVHRVVRAETFYAVHGAVARSRSVRECPHGLDTILAA